MNKTINQKVSGAARRYLELKGFEVLDEFELAGVPYIAADDCGEVVVARVSYSTERVPEPWSDRDAFEMAAAHFLKGRDEADVPVRGDSIDLMVLGDSRAMLRHATNVTGGSAGA